VETKVPKSDDPFIAELWQTLVAAKFGPGGRVQSKPALTASMLGKFPVYASQATDNKPAREAPLRQALRKIKPTKTALPWM